MAETNISLARLKIRDLIHWMGLQKYASDLPSIPHLYDKSRV